MHPQVRPSDSSQGGFTLMELMVGLAIGMLATVVIVQVMSVFEAQKRTTTGTADAQVNGGIALFNLAREAQMAGYTLMPVANAAIECTTLTIDGTADASVPNRLSPLAIVEGVASAGVSASDAITIRYGNSASGGVPTPINSVGNPSANDLTVSTNVGCQVGDRTLIINGSACLMSRVTAVSGTSTV
jgi:type IV pilus assembly protein PilW